MSRGEIAPSTLVISAGAPRVSWFIVEMLRPGQLGAAISLRQIPAQLAYRRQYERNCKNSQSRWKHEIGHEGGLGCNLSLRLAGDDVTQQEPIVFVVDDDESVRNSLRRLLTSVGLAVEVFPSAQAFLERASDDVPGCLVLDVQLPDLNGLELQTKLAGSNMSLPIVFLTGHGDIPMTVKAIKAG